MPLDGNNQCRRSDGAPAAKSLLQEVTLLAESLPEITSFVVRFVHAGPPIGAGAGTDVEPRVGAGLRPAPTRGSILNVQTNQELPFLRWEEAVAFIRRYVTLPDENEPPEPGAPVGAGLRPAPTDRDAPTRPTGHAPLTHE